MRFKVYVIGAEVTDDPEGDFLSQFRRDMRQGRVPRISCWADLRAYLRDRHACEEAIEAAENVWRIYEEACRK